MQFELETSGIVVDHNANASTKGTPLWLHLMYQGVHSPLATTCVTQLPFVLMTTFEHATHLTFHPSPIFSASSHPLHRYGFPRLPRFLCLLSASLWIPRLSCFLRLLIHLAHIRPCLRATVDIHVGLESWINKVHPSFHLSARGPCDPAQLFAFAGGGEPSTRYVNSPWWEGIPANNTFWDKTFGDMLHVVDTGIGASAFLSPINMSRCYQYFMLQSIFHVAINISKTSDACTTNSHILQSSPTRSPATTQVHRQTCKITHSHVANPEDEREHLCNVT
jgi:hypothetical protein